jgi:hypothetical protein
MVEQFVEYHPAGESDEPRKAKRDEPNAKEQADSLREQRTAEKKEAKRNI